MSQHDDWVPEQDQDQDQPQDDHAPADSAQAESTKPDEAEPGEASSDESEQAGDDSQGAKKPRRDRRREEYAPPDERSRTALEFVQNVIEDMEMDCQVRLKRPPEENPDEIIVEIIGKDSGRIIGKKGQVLQALQFLAHRVINRPGQERRHILVDAEGYRSRRDNNLATMARRLGKQAVELGKIITFEPMNPRDRRVVHMALAKFEGVITKSDGEGDDRRVQIIPVRR